VATNRPIVQPWCRNGNYFIPHKKWKNNNCVMKILLKYFKANSYQVEGEKTK
jgi:hypothetical protein